MKASAREEIAVRIPVQGDEQSIQKLLSQLGYDVALGQLRTQLSELIGSRSDATLVATADDVVVGLIALHWSLMLQHPAPVCRITTLVVNDSTRGQGVGRVLVEAGAEVARLAGCETLELTTALHRTEAHAFYKTLGFTNSSLKFGRTIGTPVP